MSTSKHVTMKRIVLAVALAAAGTQMAIADDGGMGRFSESYQYFASQPFDKSPSAWRQAHPNGLSEQQLEALSNEEAPWNPAPPVSTTADPTFRETHPHGLTEREFQALSSEGPAWHRASNATSVASGSSTDVAQGGAKPTL